ncbi:hypothetical protein LguiB_011042 [Lonicera macranthoides]
MAAGKCLQPAELTASGRPILHPGEIESSLLSSVDILSEENPNFPHFKSGLLILTTHRLLWISETLTSLSTSSATSAAGSIPLAAITHIFSSKKSIKSMFASPRVRLMVSTTLEGVVDEKGTKSIVLTIVLRGKSSDPDSFTAKLWECWRGRAWEAKVSEGPSSSGSGQFGSGDGGASGVAIRVPVVGVAGILRKEQEMWESTDKSLQDAFQDLNALMSKAKEMVMLAEKMRLKLLSGSNNQANATNDEETPSKEEMQNLLLSVGIASPVTKESAGALYHQQLSRQLADFVKIPIERAGGVINLIDIYCLFNRARGTELISPDDLLQACSLWEKFDVPVMLRKFDSGVMVIQNKSHSDDEVFARIRTLVLKPDALRTGISASDAAMTLGIAPAMAKEHLLTAESKGMFLQTVFPNSFNVFLLSFGEIELYDIFLFFCNEYNSLWRLGV